MYGTELRLSASVDTGASAAAGCCRTELGRSVLVDADCSLLLAPGTTSCSKISTQQ